MNRSVKTSNNRSVSNAQYVYTATNHFKTLISQTSVGLSEEEYKHLCDFAEVGYRHATEKDKYLFSLTDTVGDWASAVLPKNSSSVSYSRFIDISLMYNGKVKNSISDPEERERLPLIDPSIVFYSIVGAVTLALACIFFTMLIVGICSSYFLFNPFFMLMFSVGFMGLFVTDVVAYVEWRKANREKQKGA